MKEYLSKIRKLGHNDTLNKNTFNSIIEQLQHNTDLLYRSLGSSVKNWNISELIYGNLMDYDQVGDKRYNNGGLLDSLEKILTFEPIEGTVSFQNTSLLNNNYWLNWLVPSGINQNITLKRNIVVPETLKHQTILIGIKFIPVVSSQPVVDERFEIYVNNTYCGTGETDVIKVNNIDTAKTIYGVYSLKGDETNLEVSLVRSFSNNVTPSSYSIKIQAMFVGLHTLGIDSHILNFPLTGSKITNNGNDINNYYDFDNNAIKPIPSFLTFSDTIGTSGILNVNVYPQSNSTNPNTYYLGVYGTGNESGSDALNYMSYTEFFNITSFNSDRIDLYLEEYNNYGNFTFTKNNYVIHVNSSTTELTINSILVDDVSSLVIEVTPDTGVTSSITVNSLTVKGASTFKFESKASNDVILYNNGVNIDEASNLIVNTGIFSTPVISAGSFVVENNSTAVITLADSSLNNASTVNGFGLSTGPIYANNSKLVFNTEDTNMRFHIGRGTLNNSIELNNSSFTSNDFLQLTTSATTKKFKGFKNSSFEINGNIQVDGGLTSFTDVDLSVYSSLSSNVSISGLNQTVTNSIITEI